MHQFTVIQPIWADEYAEYGYHPESLQTIDDKVIYKLNESSFAVSPDGVGLYFYDSLGEVLIEYA